MALSWLKGAWFQSQKEEVDLVDPRFPPDWCVYALLYTTAYADNVLSDEEADEVFALRHRANTLLNTSDAKVEDWERQYEEILGQSNHVYPLVDLACEKLKRGDGRETAVFTHCVDLVFADRRVVPDEQEYLNYISEKLGIPEKTREDILTVIGWKHAV